MHKTSILSLAFSGLLVASPLTMAEEAHHPESVAGPDMESATMSGTPADGSSTSADVRVDAETSMAPGTMQPGMAGQGANMLSPAGGAPGPMMMGGPGMAGKGQMMHRPMMGGMQGMGGSPGGGMMMGKGGMMHRQMMGRMQGMGGRAGGCMMMGSQGQMGKGGMMKKHRDVVTRLDLIDARLAKIEVLLERLMQR